MERQNSIISSVGLNTDNIYILYFITLYIHNSSLAPGGQLRATNRNDAECNIEGSEYIQRA